MRKPSSHSSRFNKSDPSFMLEHRYRVTGGEGDKCSQCGSPFHPATGSDDGKYKHCGPCVRSLIDGLKSMTAKRMTGGVDFYQHAFPPPPPNHSATCECGDCWSFPTEEFRLDGV